MAAHAPTGSPMHGRDPFGARRRLHQRLPAVLDPGERLQAVVSVFRRDLVRSGVMLGAPIGLGAVTLWRFGPLGVAVTLVLLPFTWRSVQRSAQPTLLACTDRNVVVIQTTGWLGTSPLA